MRKIVPVAVAGWALSLLTAAAQADVLYVNNRTGSNRNDGQVPTIEGLVSGPVRTISRAIQLARPSDTIIIANTGQPYYESISLTGRQVSGSEARPLHIQGGGAVLSGLIAIPDSAWQEVATDLWKVVPWRKGFFQLTLNGEAVPELRPADGEVWSEQPEVPVGSWCAWRGAIYYRSEKNVSPETLNFGIAARDCGLTLLDVEHVKISDLTVQHFRVDGISVHDRARQVLLENVILEANGRAGLAVAGSSEAHVTGASIRANRRYSVLITEAGTVNFEASELDQEPVLESSAEDKERARRMTQGQKLLRESNP